MEQAGRVNSLPPGTGWRFVVGIWQIRSAAAGHGRGPSGTSPNVAPMADVLLFHHIQGLTPGVVALADRLRAAGHTVHTPDLYGGGAVAPPPGGAAFSRGDGAGDLAALADAAAAELSGALVYAGISSGVMQAQRLAQTSPG